MRKLENLAERYKVPPGEGGAEGGKGISRMRAPGSLGQMPGRGTCVDSIQQA